MSSTVVHNGDIDTILDDAPAPLKFIKSYVPALDGPSNSNRASHFSPTATIKTNNDAPVPFSSMGPMFEMRAKMTLRFWHVVNRVWVVDNLEKKDSVTVLMDWTSTTIFHEAEDKPAVVPEFSVIKLLRATEEEGGVHGLWIESVENWMDVTPVKEVRAQLHKEVPSSKTSE